MTDRKGDDFLTKDDLIKLNGLCGNYLHRGTFSGIFERKLFRRVPFDEIANHAQRIVNLLGHHTMHLSRKRTTVFYCWLFGPNGRVGTAIASERE